MALNNDIHTADNSEPNGQDRFGDHPDGQDRFGDHPDGQNRFGDHPDGQNHYGNHGNGSDSDTNPTGEDHLVWVTPPVLLSEAEAPMPGAAGGI